MDEHDDDDEDDDDDDDIIMVPVKVEEDLEDSNDGMLKASTAAAAASTPKHLVDVEIIMRIDKRATIMARDDLVVVIVIIDLLDISIVLFLFIIIIIWLDHYFYTRSSATLIRIRRSAKKVVEVRSSRLNRGARSRCSHTDNNNLGG